MREKDAHLSESRRLLAPLKWLIQVIITTIMFTRSSERIFNTMRYTGRYVTHHSLEMTKKLVDFYLHFNKTQSQSIGLKNSQGGYMRNMRGFWCLFKICIHDDFWDAQYTKVQFFQKGQKKFLFECNSWSLCFIDCSKNWVSHNLESMSCIFSRNFFTFFSIFHDYFLKHKLSNSVTVGLGQASSSF